ncbi:MAG TPA: DUF2442 domain-containing protein [Blastocatellia bacterium]|jgi:hypothetical protein|nr:DUF2442 domain-containing protein [Blastocatellia bacterium]
MPTIKDERLAHVFFIHEEIRVRLMGGRTMTAPLAWHPRPLNAAERRRDDWKISGGGYGVHWPDIDKDLSAEGLLRGSPAPRTSLAAD